MDLIWFIIGVYAYELVDKIEVVESALLPSKTKLKIQPDNNQPKPNLTHTPRLPIPPTQPFCKN